MPHALLALAGDALPRLRTAPLLRRYRYGPATREGRLGARRPDPVGSAEASAAPARCTSAAARTSCSRTIASAERGLPERPFLLLGQQSIADPTRAPEGKHTAWAYTHGPQRGVDWAREQRPPRRAHRGAGRALRARLPRPHPRPPRARARPTSRRRNANLVGGDVGGGSYRARQVVFRPVPALSPYRTPLRGLFLGSAATFPGGAVHGVPGDAAARAALADASKR